ncbi:MAG TPA: hypothetical protein VNA12_02440 [Mycobacteriales bacterium]|nr:hypothetical protein [Mycobacteriales bacterium]
MSHPQLRRRTGGALLLAALALVSSGAVSASAAARSGGDGRFPFKFADCVGLWFKTYSPRAGLEKAVPDRYEVIAGQSNGSPLDDVAGLVYGNLYIQTDRCVDGKGRPATISRVSVQVRQPAFDPGQRPVAFPDADKPVGNFWEYYYLLAVVLPDGEEATHKLGQYLARHGLPVHVGTVDAALAKMDAAPTAYVAPTTRVEAATFDYRVDGVAASAVKEGLHEHVSSYYHDVVGRDRRVRTTRTVIDSLTFDWVAACNATSTGARMTELMGASSNPNGACFHMEGPHTWVTTAKLP